MTTLAKTLRIGGAAAAVAVMAAVAFVSTDDTVFESAPVVAPSGAPAEVEVQVQAESPPAFEITLAPPGEPATAAAPPAAAPQQPAPEVTASAPATAEPAPPVAEPTSTRAELVPALAGPVPEATASVPAATLPAPPAAAPASISAELVPAPVGLTPELTASVPAAAGPSPPAAAPASTRAELVPVPADLAPPPAQQQNAAAGMPQAVAPPQVKEARLEFNVSPGEHVDTPRPPRSDLAYLHYYVYAEILPIERPADIALDSLKDVSVGSPVEEIKRASEAFGINFNFMKAVAKIESDFDPKQRTGSYIGLFQLSRYEFKKYGSGEITSARDNAIAAAYKFLTEATLFEWDTHKKPTYSDLYLIHQQGWQGAAEHVSHPERIAWKSMCATDEGKEKGEKWCKRAVWGNTLPALKHAWKSVDKLTSAAFVTMWRERVNRLYARYSEAASAQPKP